MFIVNGNMFDGDTYWAREIDLSCIRKSAAEFVRLLQDKLSKEFDRVHEAWDEGIQDPGCNTDIEGVFLANTDDDLDEYILKGIPKVEGNGHWKVYSLRKGMIVKNPDGFAEEISGAIPKNVEGVITKELAGREWR